MTLGQHLAFTGVAGALLLPFRPLQEILIFGASAILIDVDHYLLYIVRRRRYDIKGMFRYYDELQPIQHTIPYVGLCLFHTVDVLLLMGLLAWFFPLFRPVVAGMLFHHLLDIIDLVRNGVPFIRAIFLVEHFIRRRMKGYPFY